MLDGYEDKSAYAQCIFAVAINPNADPRIFVGRTYGKIVPPRGDAAFGWDPIFLPDGYDETYAEMSIETKNKISHRAAALDRLKDFF